MDEPGSDQDVERERVGVTNQVPTNGDETAQLRELAQRQEIAIAVLRQRLIEVELELVNARCETHVRDLAR